tara:strand:- start:199 stop:510 length:312 start_codon:yes stop_codon:yes gene_type:complete
MSSVLLNIKELVSFYIKINYEEYLKENNIDKIEESKIKDIITEMFNTRKEHLLQFLKESLQDILKDEYPGNERINDIYNDLLSDRDFCITKVTTEIKLYQKNK